MYNYIKISQKRNGIEEIETESFETIKEAYEYIKDDIKFDLLMRKALKCPDGKAYIKKDITVDDVCCGDAPIAVNKHYVVDVGVLTDRYYIVQTVSSLMKDKSVETIDDDVVRLV